MPGEELKRRLRRIFTLEITCTVRDEKFSSLQCDLEGEIRLLLIKYIRSHEKC